MVAILDIAISIIGTTVFPVKSNAEVKTDKKYVIIPNITSALLFILLNLSTKKRDVLDCCDK